MRREVEKNLHGREYSYDTYKVNKGGKMKKDVITYFTGIKEQLNTLSQMDLEDKEMFIAGIHNEIRFREKRLSFHNMCSLILEKVLNNSSHSQIKSFFKSCSGSFFELFTDRSASHPMQAMLFRVADVMMAEHVSGKMIPWEKFTPREGEDSEDEDGNNKENEANSSDSDSSDSDSSDSDSSDSDSDNEKKKKVAKKSEKLKFNRRNPNQGPAISMQDLFFAMCTELSTKWTLMMSNPQGAIVMRTIILILSGRTSIDKDMVFSVIKNKNPDAGESSKGFLRTSAKGAVGPNGHFIPAAKPTAEDKKIEILSQSRSHIKKLRNILTDIVSAICEIEDEEIQSACYRPSIAPVFQTLLIALAERQRKDEHVVTLASFISRLLGWKAGKGQITLQQEDDKSEDDSTDSDSDDEEKKTQKAAKDATVTELFKLGPGSAQHVGEMMRHSTASYLLEVVFSASPDAVLTNFIYKHIIGKLNQLALDNNATHCVQKLFDSLSTDAAFTLLFDELAPHFTDIIFRNKAGVIWSIVEAAARIGCKQSHVIKALSTSLGVTRSSDKTLFQKLLSLDTSVPRQKQKQGVVEEEDEEEAVTAETVLAKVEKNAVHVKYLGCRIAQTVFKLTPQAMAPFLASIHAINTETLVALLKDKLGLRVMQAYVLESPANKKEKFKLVKKLDGRYAEIVASNSDAGFFVEKVYFYADLDVKTLIAKDLAYNDRRLTGVRGGVPLLKKLRISQYKSTYKPYDGEPGFPVYNQTSESATVALTAAEKSAARDMFAEIIQLRPTATPAPTTRATTSTAAASKSPSTIVMHDDEIEDDIAAEDDGGNDLEEEEVTKPKISASAFMAGDELEESDNDDEPIIDAKTLKRYRDADDDSSDEEPSKTSKKRK